MRHNRIFWMSLLCFLTILPLKAIAQGASIEGTVILEVEDYADHARQKYAIKDKNGKRTDLVSDQQLNSLKPGSKVRVKGSYKGKKIQVEEPIVLMDGGDGSQTVTTAGAINAVEGTRRVLVMLVKFENSASEYSTLAEVKDMVFNQGNNFYLENSKGKVGLTGDTIGYLTVPLDKFVCDTTAIGNEADVLARQQGFEPNNYDHIMYIIESSLGCRWSGQGTISGTPGRSWIKNFQIKTVVHELGHNLGLFHSHSKDCGEATNSGTCNISEYGDVFDAMGAQIAHFNAFQKERLGWLDNQVATVTSDQTLTLDFYQSSDNLSTKAAKIYIGNDSQGNAKYYYLEHREPFGFDSDLFDQYPNLVNSLILREGTANTPSSSYLLDSTPMSSSSDMSDSMIGGGQIFQDQINNVTIELVSVNNSQATVSIKLNGAVSCATSAPSLTGTSNIEMSTGQQKTLSYTLKNNDSNGCQNNNISLDSVMPSGWVGQWQSNSVTLAPQQSTTISLSLTVDDTVGSQQVTLKAQSGTSSKSTEFSQTINVTGTSSNSAPVAVVDTLTLDSKASKSIAVLSNDSDPDGDALSVVSVSGAAKGSVKINSDNTVTYTPAKSFKSSDSFTYTISDGELTSTATVDVVLSSSSGGGSGGGGKGRNK